ncbi:MAG: hypothetical protein IT438_04515 [Phycisphaerales bacterium]|nr:hypothetical protein [Phycisphaerales bacterium]
MSKTTNPQPDNSLASIEPGKDSNGKALRTDPKSDAPGGGGGVFRLDALAPGAAEAGKDAFAAPKSRVSQSALFFLVLMVIGGGILFFMRQIGIGPMASFAKIKAPDYDVTKDLKGKTGDHKRVLKDLSESSVKTQVPIDQVQKNPFKLAEMVNTPPDPNEDGEKAARAAAERARRDQEARRRQVDSVLGTLKVRAILGSGPNSVAQINDDAVRIGDSIQELFTVKAMRDREIDLETEDGQVYTISLDDGSNAGKSKSAPRRK